MADELNWSGAFYESLAGSIGRVTRGGPLGMATGVIGEASAAMRGINTPWQGPRTAASLAAAAGGGFVLLNAGRSLVEAVNAAGQEDYGSALTNAAIGVGWYAGGRFALGAMARGLPLEKGALAAYEEAAEAKFAREDPDRYQQIIGRLKKEQNVAQAAADSAAVASANTVNPAQVQTAATQAAEMSAEMTSNPKTRKRRARNTGAGTVTAQPTPQDAAQMSAEMAATSAANRTNAVNIAGAQPRQLELDLLGAQGGPEPINVDPMGPQGGPRQLTLDLRPPIPTERRRFRAKGARLEPLPQSRFVRPGPPPVIPPPVITSRGPGMARGRARGGVRGMVRRFSVLARRAARWAARRWGYFPY